MMKIVFIFFVSLVVLFANEVLKPIPLNSLTYDETQVIVNKGTERPFSGKYYNYKQDGTYTCKRCDAPLYRSSDKFDSGCGWPSFDDEIPGAIKRVKDADGRRTEIVCARCGAHLGHVFEGEGFTDKNVRHCVNSISLNFKAEKKTNEKKAYFAGGCFWGVEYYLEKLQGVKSVVSGYMGGWKKNPTYKDVSRGDSGHLEVVEVVYDPAKIDYETLAKNFFEIHDFAQQNGQGPDIGKQYLSAVFVSSDDENKTISKLLNELRAKGYTPATSLHKKSKFYKAEEYHQDYYVRHHKEPYCHSYKKIFEK